MLPQYCIASGVAKKLPLNITVYHDNLFLFTLADLQNVDGNLLGKMYIMVVHWGETTAFQCISDL